jgi:prepilin-type N-terminal cleavage/methylation domain-containing protein
MARASQAGSRRGFTLVEMAMSLGLMGLVVGAVTAIQQRTAEHSRAMIARGQAERRAIRSLERVSEEMIGLAQTMLTPDPSTAFGAATIEFRRPTGVDGAGAVTWTGAFRIGLQAEFGELDNGLDDDGDALVDERRLVLTRNAGMANESAVVLCKGVAELLAGETANGADDNGNGLIDEAGFSVSRTGDLLRIRITVQEPAAGGQFVEATAETALVLRN